MITVNGTPVGKARPRVDSRRGIVYTPKKTKDFETALSWAARQAKIDLGASAVIAVVTSYFPIAKSWTKKDREAAEKGLLLMTKKPDADNLIKSSLDGIQPVAFHDDCQVVACVCFKGYSTEPRMEIELYPVEVVDEIYIAKTESGDAICGTDLRYVLAVILQCARSEE